MEQKQPSRLRFRDLFKRRERVILQTEDKFISIQDYERERSKKIQEVWNQVLRVLGLGVFVFLVVFTVYAFGVLTINSDLNTGETGADAGAFDIWVTHVDDNILQTLPFTRGLLVGIIWVILVGVVAGSIYLVAFSIRDLIGVIKNLINFGKKTVTNIGDTAGYSLGQEIGLDIDKIRARMGKDLGLPEPEVKKPEAKKPAPKKKRATPKKKKVEKPVEEDPFSHLTPEQADLILSGKAKVEDFIVKTDKVETVEPVTDTVVPKEESTVVKKTLFDDIK